MSLHKVKDFEPIASTDNVLIRNVISVDVEDYFHAEVFSKVVRPTDWDTCPPRVENNTRRILELFARRDVQATFFVLGWVAQRYPGLVREIAAAVTNWRAIPTRINSFTTCNRKSSATILAGPRI